MATLPASVTESQTVTAIYSWWEGKLQRQSRRLGASRIGRECERELWYGFRWCGTAKQPWSGRMLRLFNRGHREEAVFTDELRGIGYTVHDLDPNTGEQFTFTAVGGHFVAKIDGVALGVFDAPKTWHNVSYKTSNEKGYVELAGKKELREKGIKGGKGVQGGKPEHYDQNQVEMKLADLTRTLYLSANKDTDELYSERIRYDPKHADRLLAKAERVIYSPEPLGRLSEDPAHWKCKGCAMASVCHGVALPPVSCRTCVHATPEPDGDGRWSCGWWKEDAGKPSTIPLDAQRDGCDQHRYIPALLARWGEAIDASEQENWIEYRAADGLTFRNGAWAAGSYTSRELAACATPAVLRDAQFLAIRDKYQGDAQIAGYEKEAA